MMQAMLCRNHVFGIGCRKIVRNICHFDVDTCSPLRLGHGGVLRSSFGSGWGNSEHKHHKPSDGVRTFLMFEAAGSWIPK